jgi:hypothetical protein
MSKQFHLPHKPKLLAIFLHKGEISIILSEPSPIEPNLNEALDAPRFSSDSTSLNSGISLACAYTNDDPEKSKNNSESRLIEIRENEDSPNADTRHFIANNTPLNESFVSKFVSSSSHLPIEAFIPSEILKFFDPYPRELAVLLSLSRIEHAVNAVLKEESI